MLGGLPHTQRGLRVARHRVRQIVWLRSNGVTTLLAHSSGCAVELQRWQLVDQGQQPYRVTWWVLPRLPVGLHERVCAGASGAAAASGENTIGSRCSRYVCARFIARNRPWGEQGVAARCGACMCSCVHLFGTHMGSMIVALPPQDPHKPVLHHFAVVPMPPSLKLHQ